MYSEPISVPVAIRQILASNKAYMQALELGIANYTALAERIKPEVEKITGTRVNINTIVVGIKRIADTIEKKDEEEGPALPKGARMSLTGNIIDVNFDTEFDTLSNMLDEVFEKDIAYNLFQTDRHFSLFAQDVDEVRRVIQLASKKFDSRVREGLSKISIILGPAFEQDPYGLLSLVSDILYNYQIPIQNAFFTSNEIVLILEDKDAAKAYELLRSRLVR